MWALATALRVKSIVGEEAVKGGPQDTARWYACADLPGPRGCSIYRLAERAADVGSSPKLKTRSYRISEQSV